MMSFGLDAIKSSGVMFHFSSVPGRKFSMRMSAVSINSLATRWPSSWRKSRVIDFFPRAMTGHQSDMPSAFSRPHSRMGSPSIGGSILMTSAPKSAMSWPQKGPATSCPISITRMSERAVTVW